MNPNRSLGTLLMAKESFSRQANVLGNFSEHHR